MQHTAINTISQAVQAIVDLHTLPPQIDYRRTEQLRAIAAEAFLETLSENEQRKAAKQIHDQIDAYYAPSFTGTDGRTYSVAELDAMF